MLSYAIEREKMAGLKWPSEPTHSHIKLELGEQGEPWLNTGERNVKGRTKDIIFTWIHNNLCSISYAPIRLENSLHIKKKRAEEDKVGLGLRERWKIPLEKTSHI